MEQLRIVLADDHTLFREGTRELLERDPDLVVVGEAADGAEAIEAVSRLAPDVAIIDIEMPGMDGLEATKRIAQQHPRTKILVLTVHDEEPLVFAILEAGAAGYLLKDVRSTELIRAVRALCAGESVLHPTITQQVLARVRSPSKPAPAAQELTAEEALMLRAAATGETNRAIAEILGVSSRTVELRFTRIFEKLGVGSRIEAVVQATRRGLLELEPTP